jgi:hypothetical protein
MKGSVVRMLGVMMANLFANTHISSEEKKEQASVYNKQSGGLLFSSGPQPRKTLNQRQKRKLGRQNPHSKYAK